MSEFAYAPARPSRLSVWFLTISSLVFALCFISGLVLWWAKRGQAQQLEPPPWLHAWRILHGCTNPIICILAGYLWNGHVRIGWQMRANRSTGLVVAISFCTLILSGLGIYYANGGWIGSWHLALGLAVPWVIAGHVLTGWRWTKKISK